MINYPHEQTTLATARVVIVLALLGLCPSLLAKKAATTPAAQHLAEYLRQARADAGGEPRSPGSLWRPDALFLDLASDYKARRLHDLITIRISEQTRAEANGAVKSARKVSASSGLSGLFGQVGERSGLQTMFSPKSEQALDGQAQTASNSRLLTSLTGRVIEVLPNGNLVVEATREVEMNNQRQTVILRGVVRPGDIGSDNSVPSSVVGNLMVELSGKGVVSDGIRPPNRIARFILRLLGF